MHILVEATLCQSTSKQPLTSSFFGWPQTASTARTEYGCCGWSTQKKGQVRIGITDYLQQRNGDIAFVQVYPPGAKIAAGGVFAEIETIKAYVSIYSPVAGEIIEINPALELTPELVNQDPYGEGWLAVIETTSWEADRARLMDPQAYLSVMRSQAEEELNKS